MTDKTDGTMPAGNADATDGLGTVIVVATLIVATRQSAQVTIFDYPVFLEDSNARRNLWGVASGMAPGSNVPTVKTGADDKGDPRAAALARLQPSNALGQEVKP
jgi:hypothetical protein